MARGWRELGVHSWRNGLGMLRSPELALMHCVVAAILGIVVGAVYYQSGLDKEGETTRDVYRSAPRWSWFMQR